jgi:hypothetical protein
LWWCKRRYHCTTMTTGGSAQKRCRHSSAANHRPDHERHRSTSILLSPLNGIYAQNVTPSTVPFHTSCSTHAKQSSGRVYEERHRGPEVPPPPEQMLKKAALATGCKTAYSQHARSCRESMVECVRVRNTVLAIPAPTTFE